MMLGLRTSSVSIATPNVSSKSGQKPDGSKRPSTTADRCPHQLLRRHACAPPEQFAAKIDAHVPGPCVIRLLQCAVVAHPGACGSTSALAVYLMACHSGIKHSCVCGTPWSTARQWRRRERERGIEIMGCGHHQPSACLFALGAAPPPVRAFAECLVRAIPSQS